MFIVGVFFAALVARRNWKLGRTDRQGALRIAIAFFVLGLCAWLGLFHPVSSSDLLDLSQSKIDNLVGSGAFLWLLYLAIEPAIRSRFPHSIVTWNRLLAGRWSGLPELPRGRVWLLQ